MSTPIERLDAWIREYDEAQYQMRLADLEVALERVEELQHHVASLEDCLSDVFRQLSDLEYRLNKLEDE